MRAFAMLVAILIGMGAQLRGDAWQELPVDGAIAPKVLKEVKPHYPAAVKAAGVEGTVRMECVVRPDGTVGEGRVIVPLHPDLDREALRALADWRFLPGRKDGKPVPVRVEVEMSFKLRDPVPAPKGPPLGSPEVHMPGDGVTLPVLVYERKPSYTANAMRAKAQGRVKLECVVLPDGTVGDVRVMERVHPELDDEALRTVRHWTFKPGTKDGDAVPVRVEIEMTFTLRSGPRKSGDKG